MKIYPDSLPQPTTNSLNSHASQPEETPLVIVGASTRAAAFSAIRAGMIPICFDLYADADLIRVANTVQVENFQADLIQQLADQPDSHVVYVGGMEANLETVTAIEREQSLWGNDASTIEKILDPQFLTDGLRLAQVQLPETRNSTNPPPMDGKWLIKPIHGTGGRGIALWNEEAANHPTLQEPHLFQQLIDGTSHSAVFTASAEPGDVRFVGITRQLVGLEECGAAPFQWCGNIGPVALSIGAELKIRRVGNILKWKFGFKGIYGVDFIVDAEENIWVIDINPRYPASTELLEHATGSPVLADHFAAFSSEPISPPRNFSPHPDTCLAKAILYADQTITVSKELSHPSPMDTLPDLADIPAPGTVLQPGDPICTVFATGETFDLCESTLQHRIQSVRQQLTEPA